MANKIVIIGLVLILLIAAAIIVRNFPSAQMPAIQNATSYLVPINSITNAPSSFTIIEARILNGSYLGYYPGVRYTAIFDIANTSLYNKQGNISSVPIPKNVPIFAYSVAYICDTTQSAQAIFHQYQGIMNASTITTRLNLSKLGDMSDAFAIKDFAAQQNETLYIYFFTYHNVYAKVGIYEAPKSTVVPPLVNIASLLLKTISKGQLTQ